MTRAVLADTGPLYAGLDPDDSHHARARREMERVTDDGLRVVVAYPTLYEACTLVLHRLGLPTSRRFATELAAGALLLAPEAVDHRGAIELVGRYPDQRITLFDALVAVLAQRLEIEVWTYDVDFDVMGCPVWRP